MPASPLRELASVPWVPLPVKHSLPRRSGAKTGQTEKFLKAHCRQISNFGFFQPATCNFQPSPWTSYCHRKSTYCHHDFFLHRSHWSHQFHTNTKRTRKNTKKHLKTVKEQPLQGGPTRLTLNPQPSTLNSQLSTLNPQLLSRMPIPAQVAPREARMRHARAVFSDFTCPRSVPTLPPP